MQRLAGNRRVKFFSLETFVSASEAGLCSHGRCLVCARGDGFYNSIGVIICCRQQLWVAPFPLEAQRGGHGIGIESHAFPAETDTRDPLLLGHLEDVSACYAEAAGDDGGGDKLGGSLFDNCFFGVRFHVPA
jgi:hypothetical protein